MSRKIIQTCSTQLNSSLNYLLKHYCDYITIKKEKIFLIKLFICKYVINNKLQNERCAFLNHSYVIRKDLRLLIFTKMHVRPSACYSCLGY